MSPPTAWTAVEGDTSECHTVDPKEDMQSRTNNLTLWLIGITLLFPLFVQLSGGIYNDVLPIHDSGGLLDKLPLPISIGTCIFGLFALFRNHRQGAPAIIYISALVAAMLLSLIFAVESFDIERRKVILAAQFLLPTMGLVLGQLVRDAKNTIPRAFMWVLLLVVPFQLFAGWMQSTLMLTNYLFVFSIYQHFQFVPVVFVMAFCLVTVHLWEHHKSWLRFLTVAMAIYVAASGSFLTIAFFSGFVLLFFGQKMWRLKSGRLVGFLVLGMAIAAAIGFAGLYYNIAKNSISTFGDSGNYVKKFQVLLEGKMPSNVAERLGDWKMYGDWITENNRTLAFGHVVPPPREVRTSAHNWYLDLAFNFGLIALLPVLALIAFTAHLVWRSRKSLPGETWWLAGLVAFMVLIDSNFKVTLRQPYPGIFAYFFWGLLLSRLRAAAAPRQGA